MRLAQILEKCLELGDESKTTATTTYKYSENGTDHVLKIYTKNYGKNKVDDVVYTREIDGCPVYEWSGKKTELRVSNNF